MTSSLQGYLDCCATTPAAAEVAAAMARVQDEAWANPSSLHGYGLAAAEQLERSRQELADLLGAGSHRIVFTSGGSEAIHLAVLGLARQQRDQGLPPGRLVISAVEHPASEAAAEQLRQQGWQLARIPVDRLGAVDLNRLEALLRPPTRLVSLIWGQSEVGTIQPIEAIGRLCREAGVPLHLDAVQVVGQRLIDLEALPVDLLSLAAHKLQGPRGIGALLLRSELKIQPCIGGGGQEGGLRAGTEPVALAAGMVAAVDLTRQRQRHWGAEQPLALLRTLLLERLLALPGLRLSGPDPRQHDHPERLPHHLSLLVSDRNGEPVSGRRLVQSLWREGFAVSSGSACSSGRERPSAILQAMGYSSAEAGSGLRLSLGPWHDDSLLERFPPALERVLAGL